jgi:hypothetical protein
MPPYIALVGEAFVYHCPVQQLSLEKYTPTQAIMRNTAKTYQTQCFQISKGFVPTASKP